MDEQQTLQALIAAAGLLAGLALAGLGYLVARPRAAAAEVRIAELGARVQQMGELLAKAQSQLQTQVNDRLDAVSHRLGQSMQATSQNTMENLQRLGERLAVIDTAQRNITALALQVTSLQSVLSNKQQRGAFGQARMEAIVQDGLPSSSYAFQHTLANGRRPDCCVFLPDQRPLVIDAKFPLESFTAYRDAQTEDERKAAGQRLKADVSRHIADISDKYLLPGETQELALMFVPSESIYADLYDRFEELVQKAYRSRVVMVSPSLLMLAIQVIQQIQRDARMREAADLIHAEVGNLMDDLGRLGDRVRKLQTHFNQSGEDVRQILISVEKLERRGTRIREVEFAEADDDAPAAPVFKLEAGR